MTTTKPNPKEKFPFLERAGLDFSNNSASYLNIDHDLYQSHSFSENEVEILDIKEALKKYDWLKDYYWKAVDKNKDRYTKKAEENLGGGYFIWIKKDADIDLPIETCMMIESDLFEQTVHNIVVVEEGAKANIISGCITHPNVCTSQHIGISEFYVKKGAYLNFTMVHEWNSETFVRPRSGAIVKENGNFVSNYIVLSPVKDIQMNPSISLVGENSHATLTSLLNGQEESLLDIGGTVDLIGENSSAEIISRTIARDNSKIIARGRIIGNHEQSKAHLECEGLLLSETAESQAIPELIAKKQGSTLSHEASIGKIAEEELVYLMSRGLNKEEAKSIIIRGFLDTKILHLPKNFLKQIQSLIDMV